jgi:galactokinase
MNINLLKEKFISIYHTDKKGIKVYFAPGRVNLIGEHTDYNGGYVFPCALNFGTTLLIKENGKESFRFATTNFDLQGEISIKTPFEKTGNEWYFYPLGVADQFAKAGKKFKGFDFLFSGDIPNGAGLSSSASIEMVTAFAFNDILSFGYDMISLIKLSQKAENQFIGVNCGIMDQFSIGMGAANKVISLNCSNLDYKLIPLEISGYKLVISNTNKRRGLADSKYNERRAECDTAVEEINKVKKIANLSKLSYKVFTELSSIITNPIVKKRAKHVVSENQRVLDAIIALNSGKLVEFGKLMNASHDSLRDDYEVTGNELDALVEEARKIEGVLGSRMTGAGFGGCTVSLVRENAVDDFIKNVGINYQKRTGLKADFYVAVVGDGTKRIE